MNQEYPKMLYKGNQEEYQTVIADDEDHEAELLADDWSQYGDLPEQSESEKVGEIYSTDLKASDEALAEAKAEIERLHKKLRIKELEDTSSDDLKALLTERNVQFGASDRKAVLLNLVIESDGGE